MYCTLNAAFEPIKRLRFTREHPASSYGLGVLLDEDGQVFDGATFRKLRDRDNYTIRTEHPDIVREALGLPEGEPGIERVTLFDLRVALTDADLEAARERMAEDEVYPSIEDFLLYCFAAGFDVTLAP